MSQSGTEQQLASAEPAGIAELSPAVLAERVAALADHQLPVTASSLPIWDRVGPRPRTTWRWRLLLLAMWCVTLGLLGVTGLRLAFHDAATILIWFNAFTAYVYLPAYLVLTIAAWQRRWVLALASLLIVACHLAWIGPEFRPATAFVPPAAADAESRPVRIFYANVWSTNTDYDGFFKEIAQVDPDVVVLAEVDRRWYHALKESPLRESFSYGTNFDRPFPGEIVLASKLPIHREQRLWAGKCVNSIADVRLGDDILRLFCLHGPRPLYETPNDYVAFWQKIEPILAEQPAPLIVIGDFNATQYSAVYQRLTSSRLRSAHADRGRAFATTWPNGKLPIPPIRIDQALLSPEVECIEITHGVGRGSDHKPLILDVRVHSVAERTAGATAR